MVVHEAALRREAGAYSSKPSTSSGPNQIRLGGVVSGPSTRDCTPQQLVWRNLEFPIMLC